MRSRLSEELSRRPLEGNLCSWNTSSLWQRILWRSITRYSVWAVPVSSYKCFEPVSLFLVWDYSNCARNWKPFYFSQQHSLSLRFSDECYLDQDDQVTCTRCPPGYQVIETNAKEYFVIKLSYNIYSSTKNLIRWLSNNREETVENVLMDTKGTPIRPVIHVEENKVSEIH